MSAVYSKEERFLGESSFRILCTAMISGGNMAKKTNPERNRVYKRIDLVGVSEKSFESAIENAIAKASETLMDLRWFEVNEMRGAIHGNRVSEYQVVVTVSFEVK
jgi:dodecin